MVSWREAIWSDHVAMVGFHKRDRGDSGRVAVRLGRVGESAATGPQSLTAALAAIENLPRYDQATWGYQVQDQKSGEVLASQNAQSMFDPGSTMKIYSSATALRLYGPNYRFTTPAYRQGAVSGGALNGNLVLVGSGDMSLGLRDEPNGTLYYESLPHLDQSYADIGLPGAVEPPGQHPGRAGPNCRQGARVGHHPNHRQRRRRRPSLLLLRRVPRRIDLLHLGEREPDRRSRHPRLDRPGRVRELAADDWAYTVTDHVTTVDAKGSTTLQIVEPTPGNLVVTGQIAAHSAPTLVVHQVDDPAAFARTAFIEALQEAGVRV
jgi:D-alanyl-D-alanine carboxypeptidase/D-alanyl-D-alanine-endopeptidase (penicillin-binding protein 4)